MRHFQGIGNFETNFFDCLLPSLKNPWLPPPDVCSREKVCCILVTNENIILKSVNLMLFLSVTLALKISQTVGTVSKILLRKNETFPGSRKSGILKQNFATPYFLVPKIT